MASTKVEITREGELFGFKCDKCVIGETYYQDYDTTLNIAAYHYKLHEPHQLSWNFEFNDPRIRGGTSTEDSK